MTVLFDRFFDDAAIFPPGNAAMDDAVRAHVAALASPLARHVGPFVCSASRLTALGDALAAADVDALDLALVTPAGGSAAAAITAAHDDPRLRLRAVEVAGTQPGDPLPAVPAGTPAASSSARPSRRSTCRRTSRSSCAPAARPPDAFPDDAQLASALADALEQDLRFKLTAGLHNAVRHTDPATGFEHQGFLNVVLAVHAALSELGDDLAGILGERDASAVAAAVADLDEAARGLVRSRFLSFGTCSIAEPDRRPARARPAGGGGVTGDFGRFTLPYCSFVVPGETRRRVGVGVDTDVLDLTTAAPVVVPDHADLFAHGSLDAFLAAGFETWHDVRHALTEWLGDDAHTQVVDHHLAPADQVELVLPFTVGDYVDFYASEHHATNLGRMFRPDGDALLPNWKHLPVGYHGRSGTVVVSGTPVRRPERPATLQHRRGRVRPVRPARHRGGGRLRGRRGLGARRAGGARGRRPARVRRLPRQRLVGARPAGLGVRAARSVPRQVVRDVGLAVGRADGGARVGTHASARARRPAAARISTTTAPSRGRSTCASRCGSVTR